MNNSIGITGEYNIPADLLQGVRVLGRPVERGKAQMGDYLKKMRTGIFFVIPVDNIYFFHIMGI
jgi:hypothetical protein